jgi:4-azaleucine resistance transporter AzlC
MAEDAVFTKQGALKGARQSIFLGISAVADGIVFGLLANHAGLDIYASVLMSTLLLSGTAQFLAVSLWSQPLPTANIVLTTLAMNSRNIVLGASLRVFFSRLPRLKTYLSAFFVFDETWALSTREITLGERDSAFLVGCGLVLLFAWVGGTALGQIFGSTVVNPRQLGLDFVFTAVFTALLVGFWKGRSSLLPLAVAGVVSGIASQFLPYNLHILAGGAAGSLTGTLAHYLRTRQAEEFLKT